MLYVAKDDKGSAHIRYLAVEDIVIGRIRSLGLLGWYGYIDRAIWRDFIDKPRYGRKDKMRRIDKIFWFKDLKHAEFWMANAWNLARKSRRSPLRSPNVEQIAILNTGVAKWNEWRGHNPDVKIDLTDADLFAKNLTGVNFSQANLNGARLSRARLNAAKLTGADLTSANLSGASFILADLTDASLFTADLTGTRFDQADFTGAYVYGVIWNRRKMRMKYQGIKGADSIHGNWLFRRDVLDQDVLDTLEINCYTVWWRRLMFWAWGLLDYGRSMGRVAFFAAALIIIFGLIYSIPDIIDDKNPAKTEFTPFYFSIVTFTTLGYGDVTPKNVWGELAASTEVIIGYLNLGLLLSVLSEKIARRS